MEPFRTVTYEREQAVQREREYAEAALAVAQTIQENLSLLQLRTDELGWMRVNGTGMENWQVDREFLRRMISFARLMSIQNPMIKRAVELQQLYVWALGAEFTSEHADIHEWVLNFLADSKNKVELSLPQLVEKEATLMRSGNLFWMFFINKNTGAVRVRTIPVDQIEDIYLNPIDAKEPIYYKRVYSINNEQRVVWHPDFRYMPLKGKRIDPTNGSDTETVDLNHPIFHIKTGSLEETKFGFPEVFSALPWASAYKSFLENWSTMMEAYARFAMQMSGMTNTQQAAAKSKLGTSMSRGAIGESNPPPNIASFLAMSPGVEVKAVKTAGATTPAEDGRPLALMIAAGLGFPITFFGDADVGNLATAQTLDRPTELKMVYRQSLWGSWLGDILDFALTPSCD